MDIEEIAKRLKAAFPGFDIGRIGKIAVVDAKHPSRNIIAWNIVMADRTENEIGGL